MHTLQRDSGRFAFFDQSRHAPLLFDRALNCWVATNPEHCDLLLQSPRVVVSDYASAYRELSQSIGRDFPNFLFAFSHLPLCQNGEAHHVAGRRLAGIISRRRAAQSAAIPELVDRYFAQLEPGRAVDLMTEVLDPLVTDLIGVLIGVPITEKAAMATASLVFDRMLGMGKRARIEKDLGIIAAMIRDGLGPAASDDDVGDRLALCILGHDTLLGTLGESLYQVLGRNADIPLSQIAFPPVPPETGVPLVERVVVEAFEVGGVHLVPGDRIRLMLQSLAYSGDAEERVRMFGVGIHACLGRQMSLDVWNKITSHIAAMPGFADIVDYEIRTSDFLFTCPAKLAVRLRQ